MADILERQQRMRRLRRLGRVPRRIIVDRLNPLEILTRDEVRDRYRFYPESILFIVNTVHNELEKPTRRASPLPPLLSVLCTLYFVATGTYHIVIGDVHQVSKASVGRAIDNVVRGLLALVDRFVRLREDNMRAVKTEFFNIARFPNVIGVVDCTHVKILGPSVNEPAYVNRKGFHSINVQMMCDSSFYITNLVARWPGSVHDARIFRESTISQRLENGELDGIVLGDSGYPCKKFLMTPYTNPNTPAKERFNTSLCKTRVLIEQTFGVLKRRFACLSTGLRYKPEKACQVIGACVVLHDIGMVRNDVFPRETEVNHLNPDVPAAGQDMVGSHYRDMLTNTYFA